MPEYEVITVVHYRRIVEAKNEGEASDMGWEYHEKSDVLYVYDIQVEEIVEDEEEWVNWWKDSMDSASL